MVPCPPPDPPPLEDTLRFLQRCVDGDEVVETRMSWVVLGRERVLKLKKALRNALADFSTLEARARNARAEVRLNRRLAPDVYLGVLALQRDGGRLALVPEGNLPAAGDTVDWLVHMRRLPADRMLDRMLPDGRAAPAHVEALAAVLCAFYRGAARPKVDPAAHLGRQFDEQRLDREVLLHPGFDLAGAPAALDRLDAALRRHGGLVRERVRAGRIVDGHGDLRPEHVCLLEPPRVIDCLEFNATLRQVDPFDELVFLGLECELLGAAWVGPALVDRCADGLGDRPPAALLHLYAACRAMLRARQAMAHLLDPNPRKPAKWRPLAERYLERAHGALDALDANVSVASPRGWP